MFATVGLLVAVPVSAQGVSFSGLGQAIDGDSLRVDGREVRLFGVDAPEFDQTCSRDGKAWNCGVVAADALSKLISGRDVRCLAINTDENGRTVAHCYVRSIDVNAAMVEQGLAVAYRRYSTDFVPLEDRAKAAKRGVWSGRFVMPEQYRHPPKQPRTSTRPTKNQATHNRSRDWANRADCVIKGNRNRRGQWIYHVPGMPYYDTTRAEEIFCTEAEAQASGYRRAVVR